MLLRAPCSYVLAPEQSIIPNHGEALHVLVLDRISNIYSLTCTFWHRLKCTFSLHSQLSHCVNNCISNASMNILNASKVPILHNLVSFYN